MREGHAPSGLSGHLPRFAGEDLASRPSATSILPCEAGEGDHEVVEGARTKA